MRAGVVAATLFVLVARVYSRPLGVVGTVSGLPVAPRLLDVDGDAHATRAARASETRMPGPRGSAWSTPATSSPCVRSRRRPPRSR